MIAAFLKFTGLSKLGGMLAVGAVAVAALFAFGKSKEVKGRRKEQAKQMEKTIETVSKADAAARDPKSRGVRKFDRPK